MSAIWILQLVAVSDLVCFQNLRFVVGDDLMLKQAFAVETTELGIMFVELVLIRWTETR